MPYIRIMKDWTKKTYYSWEEVNNSLKKRIREDAEDLRLEFRKYKLKEKAKNVWFSKK